MAYTANPMYTSTANMNSSYRGLASYTDAYTAQAESNSSVRSNGYNPYNTYGGYSNPNADYSRSAYGASSVRTLQSGRGIRPAGYSNGFGQVRSTSFSSVSPMMNRSVYATDLMFGHRGNNESSGTSRSFGPRRITVYDGNGDPHETPGGSGDNPDWDYLYDAEHDTWYASPDGGQTWYEWRRKSIWDGFFDWLIGAVVGSNGETWRTDRDNSHTQGEPTSTTPPVPLTDTPWMIMALLALCYLGYIAYKRRKEAKA